MVNGVQRTGRTTQRTKNRRETGSAVTEFALVLIPLVGFVFLFLNLAWYIFALACVQEAAREGVRAAVTCSPTTGLNAAIEQVIENYSFGFVTSENVSSVVSISYYSSATLGQITGQVTTGNMVKVSVTGVRVPTFASPFVNATPVYVGASSADQLACASPASP